MLAAQRCRVAGIVFVILPLLATPGHALPSAEPALAGSMRSSTAAAARADTLFLFAASGPGSLGSPGTDARGFTFDHEGDVDAAGWFGVDLTAQAGAWWHVASTGLCAGTGTDMGAALPFDAGDSVNDYALWCGRESVCHWEEPSGYGNDWAQAALLDLSDQAVQDTLHVEFAFSCDYEGGPYDWFELRVEVDGEWEPVFRNDITADRTFREYSFAIPAAELGGPGGGTRVAFYFESDGGWSNEDGNFPSELGAVWIDNVRASVDGAEVFAADFEDGLEPERISVWLVPGAGLTAALYANLFQEDACRLDQSAAWAFVDQHTTNPDYPMAVTPYGPPYIDNDVESPLLEVDQNGQPLQFTSADALHVERWIYMDLPLNALVFARDPAVAARRLESDCLGRFVRQNIVRSSELRRWYVRDDDISEYLRDSADGDTVTGVKIRIGGAVDLCGLWCDQFGDGTGHTPAPFYDNVRVYVVPAPAATWEVRDFRRFQDGFAAETGRVRIDSAEDISEGGATVVVGDSTVVEVDMTASGGLAQTFNGDAGELRPDLHLWWRVSAGPHAGVIEPDQADPDDSDGIWSPWIGTAAWAGETWGGMQADFARFYGDILHGYFAFDFNDDYFEPGDIVEFFYRAVSTDGTAAVFPVDALGPDGERERHLRVRCLPTPGERILYVEDQLGVGGAFEQALRYQGCSTVDVYSTQASLGGSNNGLGCRADAADLAGYRVIVWDSGDMKHNTLNAPGGGQNCLDVPMLQDWLDAATETSGLWVLGNSIASDMSTNSTGALHEFLGARLYSEHIDYEDLTGIRRPRVYATHPAFQVGGQEPYFDVDGDCPDIEDFDAIVLDDALSVESHAWEDDGGMDIVAGVLNRDPEGDGTEFNAQGARTSVLYNPFSLAAVERGGFDVWGELHHDYFYVMVPWVIDALWDPYPFGWCSATPAQEPAPAVTALVGAYPNPFNPKTTLRFSLAAPGAASLRIYDVGGRALRTLLSGRLDAGGYAIEWDGRDDGGRPLASGVYFARFESGATVAAEKLIILK